MPFDNAGGVVLVLTTIVAGLLLASGAAEKPKLIVLDLTAAGGVEPQIAGALSEAVTTEVASRGFFEVVSSKDMQTLLGLERQRQMAGCSDESSCLTELAGALGARFVMSGSVARLGDAYQLSLQTLDSTKAQPVGRSTRLAHDLSTLRGQLPYAVAEATGTPLPAPPSRLPSYALLAAGGLALVGGGLLGQDALARERSVNEELAHGTSTPGVLRTFAEYDRAREDIGRGKTLALATLAIGAGLIAAGFIIMPTDFGGRSTTTVAIVPTESGIAISGSWR